MTAAPQAQARILQRLLALLEMRLQQVDEWQVPLPEATAFESIEPFCVDRMSLQQWLRYLFIPRLRAMLDANAPLPGSCAITPQVEMVLHNNKKARITEVTLAIDLLLTENRMPPAKLLKQA
ncbi:YqcC family protein [Marinospirillum alkaliphilum]|uniref:Uncharacterized conserved protein YqcC, DUF446 family n=1 Tax=Marinospirillum alkaliphilum DSM 21637 TaxID=1122209 RepID=A0A1K1V0I5_9GAMM|nr:YqcC family protein [Marinospirillum alkaliphilum]SFX18093.1 Uncharacterized conserved protein YqcC, DUF446 family [Marinospirillum alkaliphilum DSM 21637]